MKKKKVVFFDAFGVIFNLAFLEWARDNAPDKFLFGLLLKWADLADIGMITLAHFRLIVGMLTGKTAEQVRQGIADKVSVNWSVVEFLRKIKRDYTIAILSNINEEFIQEIIREKKLGHLFDCIIASSKYEAVKPYPEIFLKAMQLMDCEEALLIDDSVANVTGFKESTGQKGIVFTGSVTRLEFRFRQIRLLGF